MSTRGENEPGRVSPAAPGEPEFELSGGALCLDLSNTLTERGAATPRELLPGYRHLVAWSRQTGVLDGHQVARLQKRAERQPRRAAAALHRVHEAREALFGVFSSLTRGSRASQEHLALLNAELRAALAHRHIEADASRGFAWAWDRDSDPLHQVLWPVALSAAELLVGGERERVRECDADDCAWLFLDRSRNGSRRWCDIASCGNRAKARRHRSRQREAG
jgi:predicted RNA-binding Zn ribbon-like protein